MSAKTVFTRAEREALDLMIGGAVKCAWGRAPQELPLLGDIASFLDRYTEAAIPEHILSCARHHEANPDPEGYAELRSDRYAEIFGLELWQRAVDEVRNEKP